MISMTLEQVLNRRFKTVKDMGSGMVLEVRAALAGTGVEKVQAEKLRNDLDAWLQHEKQEVFNEDASFSEAVQKALGLKQKALGVDALLKLKSSGMTCAEAKTKGFSPQSAKDAGYSPQEL